MWSEKECAEDVQIRQNDIQTRFMSPIIHITPTQALSTLYVVRKHDLRGGKHDVESGERLLKTSNSFRLPIPKDARRFRDLEYVVLYIITLDATMLQ